MATLNAVIAKFTLKAPAGLQEIRNELATTNPATDPAPTIADLTALSGFLRPRLPVSHQGALDRIIAFAGRMGALAFANFRRPAVAHQLIQRLIWPEIVEQKRTEFCGPTAFVINFCRMQPLAWSEVAINLAERGRAQVGGIQLAPGSGVRGRLRTAIGGMAEADWILIAALRDTTTSDAAYLAARLFLRKSFEEVGISWQNLEQWNKDVGFATVVSLGYFNDTPWVGNFYERPGVTIARLALKYRVAMGICTPELRMPNAIEFAREACDAGWGVYCLVDDKLGRAIEGSAIADSYWLTDRRAARGQLNTVASPAVTKGLYQGVQRALTGADAGGHVFLLLSLEIGGMYVSLNGINRGKQVTAQLLPKAAFIASVRGIIAASDSA